METLMTILCPCIKRDVRQNNHREQDGQLQHRYRLQYNPHNQVHFTDEELNRMIKDE